jgi:hypothetical protein
MKVRESPPLIKAMESLKGRLHKGTVSPFDLQFSPWGNLAVS